MHLLLCIGQVSGRLNDKIFSRVDVLYNLNNELSFVLNHVTFIGWSNGATQILQTPKYSAGFKQN